MKQPVSKIISPKDKKIIITDQSQVFILDFIDSPLVTRSLPIFIGSQAQVQYVLILATGTTAPLKINREIHLAPGAKLDSYQVYFGQGNYKVNINNFLATAAVLNTQVLFWQKQKQILQVQDNYIFTQRAGIGKFRINGLVESSAQAKYYSDLTINPAAQLTDARIDMSLYLLSPQASGKLSPSLKIAANDVKVGHSVSTFNLSLEDLFYLQSRGLNSTQIKILFINSLSGRFIANITDIGTKNLILKLIKQRAN